MHVTQPTPATLRPERQQSWEPPGGSDTQTTTPQEHRTHGTGSAWAPVGTVRRAAPTGASTLSQRERERAA